MKLPGKRKYRRWIAALLKSYAERCGHCQGRIPCDVVHERGWCQSATAAMVVAFPELRRARGYVGRKGLNGLYPHWWCVAPDGAIVDPTVGQFAHLGKRITYEEYDEAKHGPLPTGKCPNCGEYIFDGKGLHEECAAEYLAYLNREARR